MGLSRSILVWRTRHRHFTMACKLGWIWFGVAAMKDSLRLAKYVFILVHSYVCIVLRVQALAYYTKQHRQLCDEAVLAEDVSDGPTWTS